MRIRHDLLAQGSFARLRFPVLAKGDEELLVAGKDILNGSRFAGQLGAISIVSSGDAGNVGDVFRQSLLAVY